MRLRVKAPTSIASPDIRSASSIQSRYASLISEYVNSDLSGRFEFSVRFALLRAIFPFLSPVTTNFRACGLFRGMPQYNHRLWKPY
jgi:hypothetical protein